MTYTNNSRCYNLPLFNGGICPSFAPMFEIHCCKICMSYAAIASYQTEIHNGTKERISHAGIYGIVISVNEVLMLIL